MDPQRPMYPQRVRKQALGRFDTFGACRGFGQAEFRKGELLQCRGRHADFVDFVDFVHIVHLPHFADFMDSETPNSKTHNPCHALPVAVLHQCSGRPLLSPLL